jgi:hypothetical protein
MSQKHGEVAVEQKVLAGGEQASSLRSRRPEISLKFFLQVFSPAFGRKLGVGGAQ